MGDKPKESEPLLKAIIIVGLSASGKTTLAKQLEKELHNSKICNIYSTRESRGIDDDTTHKTIEDILTMNGFLFKAEATDDTYLLEVSNNKIPIAPIISPVIALLLKRYLHNKGFKPIILHMDTPNSVCKKRLEARSYSLDEIERRLNISEITKTNYDYVVNNTTPIQDIINKIKG